jgi:hypothetical protein
MKMNPEVKARWVAALRSGEYQQTRGRLYRDGAMCCLGVLCDIHAKEHGLKWEPEGSRVTYLESTGLPPLPVLEWAGLGFDENPKLVIADHCMPVAEHNDGGSGVKPRTFAEIADAIEAQL